VFVLQWLPYGLKLQSAGEMKENIQKTISVPMTQSNADELFPLAEISSLIVFFLFVFLTHAMCRTLIVLNLHLDSADKNILSHFYKVQRVVSIILMPLKITVVVKLNQFWNISFYCYFVDSLLCEN